VRSFETGQTVVRRDVHRSGHVWSEHAPRIVADTSDALVAACPPGAETGWPALYVMDLVVAPDLTSFSGRTKTSTRTCGGSASSPTPSTRQWTLPATRPSRCSRNALPVRRRRLLVGLAVEPGLARPEPSAPRGGADRGLHRQAAEPDGDRPADVVHRLPQSGCYCAGLRSVQRLRFGDVALAYPNGPKAGTVGAMSRWSAWAAR